MVTTDPVIELKNTLKKERKRTRKNGFPMAGHFNTSIRQNNLQETSNPFWMSGQPFSPQTKEKYKVRITSHSVRYTGVSWLKGISAFVSYHRITVQT